MQDKRVIFTRADGGISVIVPAPGLEDIQEHVNELIAKGHIEPIDIPRIIDVSDLPRDRILRGAWTIQEGKCTEDIEKGREIAHGLRRDKRAEEFKPLDVEATIPTKAAQAEASRQSIRDKYSDIQSSIDACSTTEQLKEIIQKL